MKRAKRDLHISILIPALLFTVLVGNVAPTQGQSVPTLDPNFKPVVTRAGGYASAVAVQADGKILLAGSFSAINGVARDGIARLNTDGSVDPAFDAGSVCCGATPGQGQISAAITALAVQKDGKVILGGDFTTIGGVARAGLARLNPDGTLDTTFDPGSGLVSLSSTYPLVAALIIQSDGKVLVGGYFNTINGVTRHGIARLNPDGTVDPGFDSGQGLLIADPAEPAVLTTLALLNSGQILVGGAFQSFDLVPRNGLARLDANGKLDGAFAPDIAQQTTPPSIDGVLVQPDGKIVISGSFDWVNPQSLLGLARLNLDGNADPAFAPNIDWANSETYTVLGLQGDGKIIAFRQINDASGNVHHSIVRLNTDSTLDPSLNLELFPGEGSRQRVAEIAFPPDGQLLVAGDFVAGANKSQDAIVRVSAAGSMDASFSPELETTGGTNPNVMALAVQPDGKVLVGGAFNRINGLERSELARLNRDGSVDASFAPMLQSSNSLGSVSAILVQGDGKVLIGGLFTAVNGTGRNGIARLNTDGSLDASFDVGSGTGDSGGVSALALQPDGKLLVAGGFTQLDALPISWMGRLNTNGSVDLGFRTGFPTCDTCSAPIIYSMGVLSNGVVMVGGLFTRVEAFQLNGLARLGTDGSVLFSFVPPITPDEQVTAMVVGKDDKTTVAILSSDPSGNSNHTRFVRFNPDGTIDAAFTPAGVVGDSSSAAPVSAMALDAGGRLLIAGQFTSVGDAPRHGLARLNPDGTLDTGFDAGTGFGSNVLQPTATPRTLVTALGLQDDGGIIVGGGFATVNNQVRLGLARFQADASNGNGNGNGGGQTDGKLVISSPKLAADGTFSMMISGQTGVPYRIDASTDLRTWTAVGNVAGTGAPAPFMDSSSKGLAQRFYRVVGQ